MQCDILHYVYQSPISFQRRNKVKFTLHKIVSFSLAVVLAAAPLTAHASVALGDDLAVSSSTVHDSTQLAAGTFWSNTYSDLRQENYVVYSPNRSVTPIVTCGDYTTQLTTVSAAAKTLEQAGYRVVAGINGDYYDTVTGVPLGSVMTNGVLRNASGNYYAIGFCDDGTTVMGKPELKLTAETGSGAQFPIFALNYVRQSSFGIFLYDSSFNARHSTGTSEAGVDVICSVKEGSLSVGGELTLTIDAVLPNATDTVIRNGQYVLSANLNSGSAYTDALLALVPGEQLSIRVAANDEKWNSVTNMIGALYQLVENGQVCSGLPGGAAPRTALGLKADGSLILYTIDGRRSGYSIGASLSQVAERLVELGCVTAMSLDGGGSTTLFATMPDLTESTLRNKPSEGSLRAVTNHVFLVASAQPSGTLHHIYLSAETDRCLPGAKVALTGSAVDTNYIPMSVPLAYAADRGSVSGSILTAPASGTVTVGAKYGGKYATQEIRVITDPDSIMLSQNGKTVTALSLSRGDKVSLTAQAVDQHLNVLGDNSRFTWRVNGNVGSVDENGVFTAVGHIASGTLSVSVGKTELTVPVTVSAEPLQTLNSFEQSFEPYTGVNAMLSQNTNEDHIRRGRASARLDYATYPGVSAEIALGYPVRSGYDCLNFWVYGDSSGTMLTLETDAGSTDIASLNFTGWQQHSVTLPAGATRIIGLSLSADTERISAIYLDQFVLSYGSVVDSDAPTIAFAPQTDPARLTAAISDDCDGATLTTLRVTYDGTALEHSYSGGTLSVALPASDGQMHRVTVIAGDASGNLARRSADIIAQDLSPAFSDMYNPDGTVHWANSYVSYLKHSGITNGSINADGSAVFYPNTNISRQEFAVLLYRYLKPAEDFSSVSVPFADRNDISSWAYDGVRAMYALGITKGSVCADGSAVFNPTANINRQEAVTMIGRLLEKGYAAPALTFRDRAQVASWAESYVSTLSAMGILTGDTDGNFLPERPMTRAQVATVLYKLL